MPDDKPEAAERGGVALNDEQKRRRARRNLAVAAALGAFIALIYLITIVRLGANVASRSF